MILFDTNVILDALEKNSEHFEWSLNLIMAAAAADNAAINAVTLAELCAGDREPESVKADLLNWDLHILDIPAASSLNADVFNSSSARKRLAAKPASTPSLFVGL